MLTYLMPWQRPCDCRCSLHFHRTRPTYDEPGCLCTITCATQPITLLADRWDCALFLDSDGDLWQVPALERGTWDWENAAEIDARHDFYDAGAVIEHLLRASAHLLANPSL
jgi:hypothetical protein